MFWPLNNNSLPYIDGKTSKTHISVKTQLGNKNEDKKLV